MDITHYLQKKDKKSHDEEDKNIEFKKFVKYLIVNDKINLLEYSYLISFAQQNGCLTNISWFEEIMNKQLEKQLEKEFNEELFNITLKTFPQFIKQKDNSIKVSLQNIKKQLIKEQTITFTDDQLKAIQKIIKFLYAKDKFSFGLYGYAGTGKTTTVVEFISFLLYKGYIKSIAFTAPTNKATNIIKSKFRHHLFQLAKNKLNKDYDSNTNIEDILDDLGKININIEFMTIHRLLNYKNDFSLEGDRVFIRRGKSNINNYQVIVIDECSMIPLQIITHILEDLRILYKNIGENFNQVPKVIFSGDPAQLPPVNEKVSAIFIKDSDEIPQSEFNKCLPDNGYITHFKQSAFDSDKIRRQQLVDDIMNMNTTTLKCVVRSKVENIIELCYNIRQWVQNEIKIPKIMKYQGKEVYIYKYSEKTRKTQTEWYKKALSYFTGQNSHNNSIMLTWTNKQADEYNNSLRHTIFKDKKQIQSYEVGDILILNDFYNFDESKVTLPQDSDKDVRFYTSEQIKIVSVEKDTMLLNKFKPDFGKKFMESKFIKQLEAKILKCISDLNSKNSKTYHIWRLNVQRLSDILDSKLSQVYSLIVIDKASESVLQLDKQITMKIIKDTNKKLVSELREHKQSIETNIIKPLWKQWNKIFCEPFANVNAGYCISCHKSQSGTFYNVFVDVDDILNNNNVNEAKRCLYTAVTRVSNELHLLI